MSFSLGIIGLPNVGKSTIFQALTKNKVATENYPFCTIDPNVGIVLVPDERLKKLAKISKSEKIIPTAIEFVDIAGLVKGASKGEGLGNKFLSHIREVDAIIQVIRNFVNDDIIHVHGKIDPEDDKQIINLELILADLETIIKHLEKIINKMKGSYDKSLIKEKNTIEKARKILEDNKLLNIIKWEKEEFKILKQLNLLSIKPIIYLYNISENDINRKLKLPDNTIPICAKLESDLTNLSEKDSKEYLKELGIKKNGLENLINTSYKLLNLITFITTGPEETKAWTIKKNTEAPKAAGIIHTDFEKGFIRAEIINCDKLLKIGSWNNAKNKGLIKMEGKEYKIKDGDTVHFHFS